MNGIVAAVRTIGVILFWVGVFWVAREWFYSRRRGVPISKFEKICLVTALPLIFCVQLALDLMGVTLLVSTTISVLAMGVALNGWAIMRRVRRSGS